MLTGLLHQFPNNPVTEIQFSNIVKRESARIYQHFQNRQAFGDGVVAQCHYISNQTVCMLKLHKNLEKLPRSLQIVLVASLNDTVGLIRDHLHFLVPLQPPPTLEQEEMGAAKLQEMNEIIRQKRAEIDKQQGDTLDKVIASVDIYKVMFDQ